MNDSLKLMLDRYEITDTQSQKNALHEVVQEIVLQALSRGSFFQHACFYGGTALRIFYGLDRFSEDLDFTLNQENSFNLEDYRSEVESTLSSYGLEFEFKSKQKRVKNAIESAFIKGGTNINLLAIGFSGAEHRDAKIKIKLEIDTHPALGFDHEAKLHLHPTAFYANTLDLPSLFSGKLHALLFRDRLQNIKGRDWYDLIWYVQRGVKYNLKYLQNKIEQTLELKEESNVLFKKGQVTETSIKDALLKRAENLDIDFARQDIQRFIKDSTSLNLWSQDFFKELIKKI